MTSFTFGSGGGVLSLLHPGSPLFPPPSIEMENALRRAVMTAAFTGAGAVPVWNLFWMFCKSDIVLITVVFMCSNSKTMLRLKSSSSSSSLFRRTTGLSQICSGDLLITLACGLHMWFYFVWLHESVCSSTKASTDFFDIFCTTDVRFFCWKTSVEPVWKRTHLPEWIFLVWFLSLLVILLVDWVEAGPSNFFMSSAQKRSPSTYPPTSEK